MAEHADHPSLSGKGDLLARLFGQTAIEFICLANSRKHGGKCVAGIRTDGKGWNRPVSGVGDGALSDAQVTLPSCGPVCALDCVRALFSRPSPTPYQPENWIASWRSWRLLARPVSESAVPLLQAQIVRGPALFGDTSDRIAYQSFSTAPATASLALVLVKFLEFHIAEHDGKRRNRAFFALGGQVYNLGLTDPAWEARLSALPLGQHSKEKVGLQRDGRLLLTISLGEPFKDGCCYKLVAAVIPVPPGWQKHF